jgi:hypothetical protein
MTGIGKELERALDKLRFALGSLGSDCMSGNWLQLQLPRVLPVNRDVSWFKCAIFSPSDLVILALAYSFRV